MNAMEITEQCEAIRLASARPGWPGFHPHPYGDTTKMRTAQETKAVQDELARLHRSPTRYEVRADHPDGRKLLIGYTARRSRSGIGSAIRQRIKIIATALDVGDADLFTWRKPASAGCDLGPWHIYITGRTQRDAVIGGELDYIGDL